MSFDHEELVHNVADIEPGAVGDVAKIWQEQGRCALQLWPQSALNAESASWRGEAAESVSDFSDKIGQFAEATGDVDMASTEASHRSDEAAIARSMRCRSRRV